MGLTQVILISVGVSLDVFAYCLYRGATISEIKKGPGLIMLGLFTVFQVGMMVIGSTITRIPAIMKSYTSVNNLWSFLAACTFFIVGITMIVKAIRKSKHRIEEKKQDEFHIKVVLIWALITSVDALIAGAGFGFMGLNVLRSAITVGCFTAVSALLGMVLGFLLGCGPMNQLIAVGGCLVLIGGADLLVHYVSAVM